MALPVTITGISTAVAPVGPFKTSGLHIGAGGAGSASFFGTGTSTKIGQTFTATSSSPLARCSFYVGSKTLSPADDHFLELRDAAGTTLLATSNSINAAAITPGEVVWTFPTPYSLVASTVYTITLCRVTGSATDYLIMATDGVDTYAGGTRRRVDSGGTWANVSGELKCTIYIADAYYFFGRDGTTATTLQAYKSTAPDTSWASVSTKTGFATGIQYISACQVGNVIHMCVTDGATTSINHKYQTFDTTTDTFVTAETINSALNTQTSASANAYNTSILVRSTVAEVVVHHQAARISTFAQTAYRRRTGVATWAAAVAVSTTGVNSINPFVVLGASDRLHFLWFNSTNTIQRHLTSANVLGTAASTGATVTVQDVITITSATPNFIGLTASGAFRWASADNPTVTNAAITFGTPIRGADTSGVSYALYQSSTDSDLYIKTSSDSGATWGTAISEFAGTVAAADANLSKNQLIYTRGSATVFPYIVNDNGTLKYDEYRLPTHYRMLAETGTLAAAGQAATLVYSGAPVTVYTPSPALNANDSNPGTNFRVFVQLSANSNGQLSVRYRAATSGALNITGAAFGKWNGTTISASSSDMTTPPFRLTFSGANGVNIASNGTATSDLVTHTGVTLNSGDWVIVTFYCNTTSNERNSTGHTTATTMFKATPGTDHSQTQTAAAMGNSMNIVGNVQPGGAGGTNYTVDLVETNAAVGVTHYTMPVTVGTLAAAGQTVVPRVTMPIPLDADLTLSGQDVALRVARRTAVGLGTLTLAGQDVTLTKTTAVTHRTMPADTGTLTLAGQTVVPRVTMPVTLGTLTLAGQPVTLRYTRVPLVAGLGTLTLSGRTVTLAYGRKPPASLGTITLTGQTATLKRNYVMPATLGTITLAGAAPNLIYSGAGSKSMPAGLGVITLAGQTVTLRYAHKLIAGTGTITLAGQTVGLRASHLPLAAGLGTLTLSGQVIATRFAHRTVAGLGTLTLAGQTAIVRYARQMPAGQGTLTPSGQNVTLRYSRKMPAGLGTITLTGPVVNTIYSGSGNKLLPAGLGFPRIDGQAATLRYSRKMPAAFGTINLAGQTVALQRARKVTAGTGSIVLEGKAAGLNYHPQARLFAETGVLGLTGCDVTMPITRRPPTIVQENLKFGRSVYVSRW